MEAALAGLRVAWCAPTSKQTHEGWDEAKNACAVLVMHKVVQFHGTDRVAYFPNGGKIEFRTLKDPDNARGITADLIILEEAGEIDEDAWRTVLRATIADTLGSVWGIGTPKGFTWFRDEWEKAQSAIQTARDKGIPYDGAAMSWRAPTLGFRIVPHPEHPWLETIVRDPHPLENPTFTWDEMLDMWDDMPKRSFLQEIGAEFMADAGGIFEKVAQAHHVPFGDKDRLTQHRYQIGVDVARKHDYTVITVLDLVNFEQVYWRRFNRTGYTEITNRVIDAWKIYKGRIVLDSTGIGDVVHDMLHDKGMSVEPINFTNTRKADLIDSLASHLEKERIHLQKNDLQKSELEGYQYKTSAFGNRVMSAPSGKFDDCVIALALAAYGQKPTVSDIRVIPATTAFTSRSPLSTIELGISW